LILSVGLVLLFLPGFNEIVGRRLSFSPDNKMIFSLVGLTVFTGLVAGSYPALYLSGFKPSLVLKGKLKGSIGELWARKGLVVFQFSLSMILIVSVLVVYRQVAFVQSKNLGFNRENIIHFQMQVDGKTDDKFFETGGELQQKLETYLREIKEIPGVISATNAGGHNLTGDHGEFSGIDWREGNDDEKMGFANLETGYNFIETLNIRLLEGRGFSRNHTNEESKVIFNEKAIQLMGLKDPVGKKVTFWGGEKEIIGVVKDFHFESLYKQIKPCVIRLEPRGNTMLVKLPAEKQSEVIARLHKFQQSRNPGLAFNYKFIDEDYQELYVAEKRVSELSKYFAAIAIIISCLGLFGLAVFTAQRRRKEIGIRKILGSGELGVIRLLSAEFMQMILTAVIIAMPLSYMAVSGWLSNFAYTTPLNWWLFAGAGVVTLIIGWLAVAAQTLSAARINPIQTIREE
jgi:putative ABC transport system permease protein